MKRWILVGLTILVLSFGTSVLAAPSTTVNVGNYALAIGQEIDVPIMVTGARDWYGVDVRMAYDPAVVQVVSVKRGVIPQPDFVLWERFDGNRIYYVTTQLNPTLPVSGDGVIVTVRLRGAAAGTAPLTLSVEAASRDGELLPVVIGTGDVTVVESAPTAIKLRSFTAH